MALGWLWWRAWVLGVAPGRRGCWRGRRGTWRHPSSFHVAGVVLGDIDFYSGVGHPSSFHVAGVVLAHKLAHTQLVITPRAHTQLVVTQLTLAWQVWHLWHWAGSGGALGFRCGAGTPRLLARQAWHLETSIFVSRGRRGTW